MAGSVMCHQRESQWNQRGPIMAMHNPSPRQYQTPATAQPLQRPLDLLGKLGSQDAPKFVPEVCPPR